MNPARCSRSYKFARPGIAALLYLSVQGVCLAEGGRTVLPMDGEWDLAQGSLTTVSASAYSHKAPVPGLVEMAAPAISNVGTSRTANEAYWYRRSFSIPGGVPQRATLQILKAAYGARVYLNGIALRDDKDRLEYNNCFASSRFDCVPALRGNGAPNELEIRVGERRTLPDDVPNGHDFEKIVYQPGIYDSVRLILSGSPWLDDVQVAPRLNSSTVDVQFSVRGATATPDIPISCTIREAKSHAVVGDLLTKVAAQPGGSATTITLPVRTPHLWTPEDPFLYELELATPADGYSTRFAMRSFSFDATSGRALLNGKPYYMRGTNVCIFRFFDDSQRGNRPWDAAWVRQLHETFKSMNWNSMRYCIGFPPELWYDIADEEGFLIQDEFPIWNGTRPTAIKPKHLAEMYREWMRDHWNHASVAIWDAQNETITTVTGAAIKLARSADLSNRPWDNGWSAAQAPGDSFEVHPYIFNNPEGRMADLEDIVPGFIGSPQENILGNAEIINEYGWLWINRNGSPCTLTTKLYQRLLGTTATAEQRRYMYAHNLAAQTEFWRATRKYAGVLHFCGLSYSRPGGQTSDNFIDLPQLRFEPWFSSRVRDAFAPVGICIQRYATSFNAGQRCEIPVSVVNDLSDAVGGQVQFSIEHAQQKVWRSEPQNVTVAALGKTTCTFQLSLPARPGNYRLVADLDTSKPANALQQLPVSSWRDIELVSTESLGLAVGCTATASSWHKDRRRTQLTNSPGKATDGDPNTRWSSEFSDTQWLAVDLGSSQTFTRIQLTWERAFATHYRLQVSDDGHDWRDIYSTTAGTGGTEDIPIAVTTARWIRFYGEKRATEFGYSLYEIRVFH